MQKVLTAIKTHVCNHKPGQLRLFWVRRCLCTSRAISVGLNRCNLHSLTAETCHMAQLSPQLHPIQPTHSAEVAECSRSWAWRYLMMWSLLNRWEDLVYNGKLFLFFFLFYCLISCILHKKVLSAPLCRLCRLMQLPSNIESRSILCGVQHQTVSGMLLTGAALLSVEILSRMTKLAMMELPSASGAELLSQGSPPIFFEGPESFWERKRLWGRPLK